jgi:hypothetical protein
LPLQPLVVREQRVRGRYLTSLVCERINYGVIALSDNRRTLQARGGGKAVLLDGAAKLGII